MQSPSQPLKQSTNKPPPPTLLELLIQLLSKHLSLQPRQAVTLLAQDCKYLGFLLIKGKKSSHNPNGQFTQLLSFLKDLQTNSNQITSNLNTQNTVLIHNVLKHCLQSKSKEVAEKGIGIVGKVRASLGGKPFGEGQGEQTSNDMNFSKEIVTCLRKHPDLKPKIAQIVTIKELREGLADREYLEILEVLIDVVEREKLEGIVAGLFKEMEGMVLKDHIQISQLVLAFVSKVGRMGVVEPFMESIMRIVKITSRKQWFSIKQLSSIVCFQLLSTLANQKSPYSSTLFKKLIFTFIQTHSSVDLRSSLTCNFTHLLSTFPTIPSNLLAQPLLKQLQMSLDITYTLNVCDLELIEALIDHPQMTMWPEMFNFTLRLVVGGGVFAGVAVGWVGKVVTGWGEAVGVREGKMVVGVYGEMRLRVGGKSGRKEAFRKQAVLKLIKEMLANGNQVLRQTIKNGLIQLYKQQDGQPDSSLYKLLSMLGVPQYITRQPTTSSLQPSQLSHQAKIRVLMQGDDRLQDILQMRTKKINSQRKIEPHFLGQFSVDMKTALDIEKSKERFLKLKKRKEVMMSASPRKIVDNRKKLSLSAINPEPKTAATNSKQPKPIPTTFSLISLAQQQQRDQRSLQTYLSTHIKPLEQIFYHFSSKSTTIPQPQLLSLALPASPPLPIISFVDCSRMLSSWSIPKNILSDLIIQINKTSGQLKNPLSGVTFKGFKQLLCQFAYAVNLRQREFVPIGVRVGHILQIIGKEVKVQEREDPEAAKLLAEMQAKEAQRGDQEEGEEGEGGFVLPPEFRKEDVEVVLVRNQVKDTVKECFCGGTNSVGKEYLGSFLVCYQVVNQLLKDCLNIQLIEPFTEFKTQTKITRKHILQNKSLILSRPHRRASSLQPLPQQQTQQPSSEDPPQSTTPATTPSPIKNSFLKNLHQKQSSSLQLQSQKEAKRLKHMKYLQTVLQKRQQLLKAKQQQKTRKKEEQQQKKQQEKERLEKRREELKGKLEENRRVLKEKEEEEKGKKEEEKGKSKEKMKEFLIREKQRMRESLKAKEKEVEEKELERKRLQKLKKEKQIQLKTRLAEIRQQSTQTLKHNQTLRQRVVQFISSTPTPKLIHSIYRHYQLKDTDFRLDASDPTSTTPSKSPGPVKKTSLVMPLIRLPVKAFNHFLLDFKICPSVVSIKEALQIYNSTQQGGDKGLREIIMMIGIKGMKALGVDLKEVMEKQQEKKGEEESPEIPPEEINQFKDIMVPSKDTLHTLETIKLVSEKIIKYLQNQKVSLSTK